MSTGGTRNKKKRTLKRRRFTSFLSLVLCVSLIAGTAANAFAEEENSSVAVSNEVQPVAESATSEGSVASVTDAENAPLQPEEASTTDPAKEADADSAESELTTNLETSSIETPALSGIDESRSSEFDVALLEAGIIQVATEQELRDAVHNSTGSVTIELTADITLTDPRPDTQGNPQPYPAMYISQYASLRAALYITVGKDITLIGNHQLIGTVTEGYTVIVNGKLTLDGPTITHAAGTTSTRGIDVGMLKSVNDMATQPRAEMIFKSGVVCGNEFYGIGVAYGDLLMTGGEIYGNGTLNSSHAGGGICVAGNGTNVQADKQFGAHVVIQGGDIHDNKAYHGGAFNVSGNSNTSLKITGGNIYNNEAEFYGGGIAATNSTPANIEISGGNIYGNTAYSGGGAHFENTPTISGGNIYENTADYGGGISSKKNLKISGGEIYKNNGTYGSGIYSFSNSALTLSGTAKIRDNVGLEGASSYGGGIYFGSGTTATISGGEISGNTATSGGGAYADNCTTTLSGGVISGNTATGSGGGMTVRSGTLDMSAGTFVGNAAIYGGGIYNAGTLNLTGGSIRNNSSTNPHDSEYASGGGIYTEDYSNLTVGENVVFAGNTANKLTQLLETDADFPAYEANISVPDGQWSVTGVQYGYNNYDINYLGSEIQRVTVTFVAGLGGSLSGVTEYTGILRGTPFGEAVSVPAVQAAEGYVFEKWSPVLPSSSQVITEDAVYTAVFVAEPVTPPTPPVPIVPPVQVIVPPATTTPTVPVTQPTLSSEPQEEISDPADEAVVTEEQTPTAAPPQSDAAWALINLILSVLGAILAVIMPISVIVRKKREEENSKKEDVRIPLLLVSIAMGILGVVVFLLTENMQLSMIWIDNWTIVNLIIFVVGIAGALLTFKNNKDDEEGAKISA